MQEETYLLVAIPHKGILNMASYLPKERAVLIQALADNQQPCEVQLQQKIHACQGLRAHNIDK